MKKRNSIASGVVFSPEFPVDTSELASRGTHLVRRSLGKPELDLLILTSRETDEPTHRTQITRCAARCRDVNAFMAHCISSKTFPLVLHNLLEASVESDHEFMAGIIRALRNATYARWSRRRRLIEQTLDDARAVLSDAKIPFLVVRGLTFAEQFYRNPELRVSDDVDLLVTEAIRVDALDAMLKGGFELREPPQRVAAKALIWGQTELISSTTGVPVDLNWRLTGNASIGTVSLDMARVWERSSARGTLEQAFSPEDTLLEAIRHAGHGHDFMSGLVRTCADICAWQRTCPDDFDWEYFHYQSGQAEANTVVQRFAYFFTNYFAMSDSEKEFFSPLVTSCSGAQRAESYAFAELALVPAIRAYPYRGKFHVELFRMNLGLIAKFWVLDRLSRAIQLLRVMLWPTNTELALLLPAERSYGTGVGRAIFAAHCLLVFPGVALGIFMRLVSAVARGRTTKGGIPKCPE